MESGHHIVWVALKHGPRFAWKAEPSSVSARCMQGVACRQPWTVSAVLPGIVMPRLDWHACNAARLGICSCLFPPLWLVPQTVEQGSRRSLYVGGEARGFVWVTTEAWIGDCSKFLMCFCVGKTFKCVCFYVPYPINQCFKVLTSMNIWPTVKRYVG